LIKDTDDLQFAECQLGRHLVGLTDFMVNPERPSLVWIIIPLHWLQVL